MPKILVVDNDTPIANHWADILENQGGYQVDMANSNSSALENLSTAPYDVVVTDVVSNNIPDQEDLLDLIVQQHAQARCIIYASETSIKQSVEVTKRGAFDYLSKNASAEEILGAVAKACERQGYTGPRRRREDFPQAYQFGELVGKSSAIQQVFKTIEKVAPSESTVLITGESGTGKELIARAIHFNSQRRSAPMVIINCGAIPGELLESELFGHEKGAFTGAHRTRIGRFEIANGGTIFLDEIGDMSPSLQVKLLRVLQEQTFERVGSTKTIKVDIRVLAATNKVLADSIDAGKFREDLYYRLNVIPINVPPLRERKSDIPLLVNFFLKRLGGRRRQDRRRMKTFSDEALSALLQYDWPGNIRELENLVERLSVLVEDSVIQLEDLPSKIRGNLSVECLPEHIDVKEGIDFNGAVEQYQRTLILQALNETNWVKAKAAELLKINRTTLVEKVKKMKIEPQSATGGFGSRPD